MSTPNDGGPAFPLPLRTGDTGFALPEKLQDPFRKGMSLRDWFAGQALPGLAHWRTLKEIESQQEVAADCYAVADAMLAERERKRE